MFKPDPVAEQYGYGWLNHDDKIDSMRSAILIRLMRDIVCDARSGHGGRKGMKVETRIIREGCHVKVGVTVDGIDCGSVTVAGTSDPNKQYLLDALAEGRLSMQDFARSMNIDIFDEG